jgi:cytochrome c peroxidase
VCYQHGDDVIAAKKGINILERGHQVNVMAEFQEMLGFPPAPKLNVLGKLDPGKATPDELRGQEIFFGKGQCGACHAAPYYTDNLMHDLKIERFFKASMINGLWETWDGPIKTFPQRGVKDSSSADAGGHRRVLQPDPWHEADRQRKAGLRRVPPSPLGINTNPCCRKICP